MASCGLVAEADAAEKDNEGSDCLHPLKFVSYSDLMVLERTLISLEAFCFTAFATGIRVETAP